MRSGRCRAIATAGGIGTLLALACQPGDPETPQLRAPAEASFRVGLLTPGSIRDAGWNQSAYEGLQRIQSELGAEVAHQVTHTPQEFEAGFRDLAARGFDLIFGHGFEFQDAAATVGKEYPETVFITSSGSTLRPNVAPIVFELEQATYVLGYLAGRLSKSGRVGAVGGIEVPSVASTFLAFSKGARAARPGTEVSVAYIGSWSDVSAAHEATLAQISVGADVLIHNLNEAVPGFFQAVRASPGVRAFGTNRNQNHLAPEAVLASATLDVPRALLLVAREVRDGRFRARSLRFGLADGVIRIEWNDPLRQGLAADLRDELDALVARIRSGELRVPRGEF